MKLKLDAAGNVVLQDGKPVYVKDDGTEVAFDAAATVATIGRLNGEAKGHRERAEAAETKVKTFEGITDPAAAIVALATVKNFKDKQLVDAGEVEKVKAEAIKAVEEKYAPVVKERDTLQGQLHAEKIGGSFSRSKFIADKMSIPADLVEARFGKNFEIAKDGKIAAKDANGQVIYSPARPGEVADFDEALEVLVNGYSQKAHILKGSAGGSGAPQNKQATAGKTITRKEYDALDPVSKATKGKELASRTLAIVD